MKLPTKGFTLIEVLFIVAIFAVFAAVFISSYQQRSAQQKVEKTALQMQEIIQAATAYYNDVGTWPSSTQPPANFSDYLPTGLAQNPWGTPYTYQVNNTFFTVNSGTLPSSNLALRIQSLLPNASINPNNPLQVVISPTQQQPTHSVAAIGVTGLLADGSTMQQPFQVSCPTGTQPYNVTMPNTILSNNDYDGCYSNITRPFGLLYAPITCTPDNQKANTYNCNLVVSFNGIMPTKKLPYSCKISSNESRGTGFIQFTYVTWCQ